MTKPRLSAEDRKRAIVQAALPLFARKGFAETTTKDLAKAAGISEPLLYKHFPGKEALYLEIQNYNCQGPDPVMQRLGGLEPSTSTLVHLVFYLMRALVLGQPRGAVAWDTRHRLMVNSLLHDGSFARLLYRNRLEGFCAKMELCLKAALQASDIVRSPVSHRNRACFAYHLAAGLALVHLPARPAIHYKVTRDELFRQAVWFALRGLGLTDEALARYYKPKELARFFGQEGKRGQI